MTPGVYKSFRKLWKRNVEKYSSLIFSNRQLAKYSLWNNAILDKIVDIADIFNDDKYIEYIFYNRNSFNINEPPKVSFVSFIRDTDFDTVDQGGDPELYKLINMTLEDVEREVYQAMEGFVHNLNTLHSRAGGQVK